MPLFRKSTREYLAEPSATLYGSTQWSCLPSTRCHMSLVLTLKQAPRSYQQNSPPSKSPSETHRWHEVSLPRWLWRT